MSGLHPHNGEANLLGDDCACHASLHATLERSGLISRLDPRTRILSAGTFALLVVSLNHLPTLGMAVALAVVAAILARLELRPTLRHMLALDGFMVLALVMLPFTVPGDTLISVYGLDASRQGLAQALAILFKANAVVLMVLALVGSMDTVALGQALGRLGTPEKLVHLYLFTVRYLDVLHREYRRLRTAMKARAFTMRSDRHTWRSVGYLFGMLMVHSVERSERIVAAMRCRGFDGSFPSMDEPTRFQRPDGLFALASLAGMVILMTIETL
ncbi:MAG TPA: cobalt ECF transporter T component CbiQ [Magnetospirillum sp.]|nr:cobalt ECF transporter T component CbiQ [Magnetospirillum sp.]